MQALITMCHKKSRLEIVKQEKQRRKKLGGWEMEKYKDLTDKEKEISDAFDAAYAAKAAVEAADTATDVAVVRDTLNSAVKKIRELLFGS